MCSQEAARKKEREARKKVVQFIYSSLNYRQRVLSPNDQVAPAQTKDNLTELFDELTRLQISHPIVSSGCADVALTAQLTFFNTPHVQCSGSCAKMNFNFQGEKIVLRNCFSKFPSIHKINHTCRVPGEEPSELALGDFRNVSICQCNNDLCNSSWNTNYSTFLAIFLTFNFITRVFS
ncbi:unnamed protein product [Caenorhabditis angaria]|uniref:Uncharacterized protein n=1 Tax=Caenorhabditis angaria TaxID=860376 RepID=A0A9P1MWC8_9PELO|nr:unnamed protein product [Caenorhabditis angaria]